MTRTTWLVAFGACLFVVAAVLAEVLTSGDDTPRSGSTPVVTSTAPSLTPSPTATATTASPVATTSTPIADVTLGVADSVLPKPSADYALAKQPVELSAICAGAVLDLGGDVQAAYTSLQTTKDPLRFLDVAVGVFPDADTAMAAFTTLSTEIAACPANRTITPTPTGTDKAEPVAIAGAARSARVGDAEAVQWVQLQTSTAPATSLRTTVTLFVFHNAVVAVSMDQDSETVEAEPLSEASRTTAEAILTALSAATG